MSDKDLPAFPRDHRYDGHNGMTLRDYFAAKALPLAASLDAEYQGDKKSLDVEYVAAMAYAIAGAMMEARKS